MRVRGFGRAPAFRGRPVVRSYVGRRPGGLLGLLSWIFPGLIGFWAGKEYGASQQTMAEREADLQEREVALRRREATLNAES